MCLQRLHIIESNGNTTCWLEITIAPMLRIQQNGTETCITSLQFICIRFKVYFYFSHALKVINYTAFRSLNLITAVYSF